MDWSHKFDEYVETKIEVEGVETEIEAKYIETEIEEEDESPIGMYINLDNTR